MAYPNWRMKSTTLFAVVRNMLFCGIEVSIPVDLGEDVVHGKGGAVVVIQEPDGLVQIGLLVIDSSRVVYADNDRRQPGQQDEDFQCENRAMAVSLPPREGVPCDERKDNGQQSV